MTTIKNRIGRGTYLHRYEGSYIVAAAEIYSENVLPKDTRSFKTDLQKVIHSVRKRKHLKEISPSSTFQYDRRVIRCVNE